MKNRCQNNNGFTIIELMIVISILGILMGAFYSNMNRSLPNYRLNRSVMELRSELQQVRLEAVKKNTNVDFDYSALNLPKGVEMVGVAGFPAPVTFNSRGFPTNLANEGQIYLKSTEGRYKGISMTIVGNSRVIRSVDDGATWF